MVTCFFCGKDKNPVQGLHLIRNDGSIIYFCSSKCRKNHEMGRKKLKWVSKQKGIGKIEAVEEEPAKAEAKEKPAEIKDEKKAEAKPKEEKKEEKK